MRPTVTVSIELELGWDIVRHRGIDALSDRRQRETEALSSLLAVCDAADIPLTFDVVGHLLLEEPLSGYDTPHPDGWFDPIPKTGPETDPEFYAPDLVDMIRSATVDHEICTHTFTHVECGNVPRETLDWEFERVREVHERDGLSEPTSFVPPRHSLPPYEALSEYGIEIIRVPEYCAPDSEEPPTKASRALDIVAGNQPARDPVLRDGVVETYTTERISLATPLLPSGQVPPHPVFRIVPIGVRKRLHSRSLKRALAFAIERNSFVHLWSYLWDIANDYQWPQIATFLEMLGEVHRSGSVAIRPMREVNEYARQRWAENRP